MKGISLVFMLFFWLLINTVNTFCLTKLMEAESRKDEKQ